MKITINPLGVQGMKPCFANLAIGECFRFCVNEMNQLLERDIAFKTGKKSYLYPARFDAHCSMTAPSATFKPSSPIQRLDAEIVIHGS